MAGLKRLFSDSVIYGVSNAVYSALPILLLPFLTVYLPKSEYGIYANFTMAFSLLSALVSYSVPASVSVYFYGKEFNVKKLVSSGLMVSVLITVGLFSVGVLAENFASSHLGLPAFLLLYAVVYSFLDTLFQTALGWWRMEHKPWLYLAYRVARMLIELGLTFYLVINFSQTWEARVISNIAAVLVLAVPIIAFLKRIKLLEFKLDRPSLVELTKFNAGNATHVLGSVLINYLDVFLITAFLGFSSSGEYAVAYQIGMGVSLLTNSFNQAYVPWLFKNLSEKSISQKRMIKLMVMISAAFFSSGGVLFILSPFLYNVFIGVDYTYESKVVFWIIAGFVVNGIYKLAINFLFFHKRMKVISGLTITAATVNFILNLWLIPKLGIQGAALATFVAFGIQALLAFLLLKRSFKLIWGK